MHKITNRLCVWLKFVCVCVCSSRCGEIAGNFYLMYVYFGYAHSQSQAVVLQVLSVGGGVVGERGVGDELRVNT